MATHSSILAWRIPWTDEAGRAQSLGLQKNWALHSDQTTIILKHFNDLITLPSACLNCPLTLAAPKEMEGSTK